MALGNQPIPPLATWSFHGLAEELAQSLSAASLAHSALWVGADEGTSLARLTRQADGQYQAQETVDLAALLRLPDFTPDDDGRLPEVDVEGMDSHDGALWLIGSHGLKRKQADKDDEQKNIARLAKVSSDGNRYVLGCLALDDKGALVAPEDYTAEHCAGRLDGDKQGSALLTALRGDAHLGRFVAGAGEEAEKRNIPGKDNGLDFEGLAVVGRDHLLVGLRGPVLRGWAILLELQLETAFSSPGHPALLTLKPFASTARPYHKIFLDLDGLGVRDLTWDGDDLLILAGPTMVLPWPVTVYRWPGARGELGKSDRLIPAKNLTRELLGQCAPTDRAESFAVVEHAGAKALLIVYDGRPADAAGTVTADLFPLTAPAA
jgi:Protein of unknown function (DUF3616)